MSSYEYDLLVIGGGSGGLAAAQTVRSLGKRVAIIEKNVIGGDYTWNNCIPSKALIHCARTAWQMRNMAWAGLTTTTEFRLDTSNVLNHVRGICQRIYQHKTPENLEKIGISVFIGTPLFLSANEVQVQHEKISASRILIATGSAPLVPDIPGLDTIPYLTTNDFFHINKLAHSFIIIGGGATGIEFAQALNRLGIKVYLFEQFQILRQEEAELVQILVDNLRKEGITLYNHTRVIRVAEKNDKITVFGRNNNGEFTVHADRLFLATGRIPNINNLNLDAVGVQFDDNGITVNAHLQTSTSNIYAAGDVTGLAHFSHAAEYQARLATFNALLPIPGKKADYSRLPWIIFSDPELAHAGFTEEQAQSIWENVKTMHIPYSKMDRAVIDLTENGMAKLVFHDHELVGIHILGERAGELMQHLLTVKLFKIPLHKIADSIFAYPSYADLVKEAGEQFAQNSIKRKWFLKNKS